jgi:hypothetical protein
MTTMRTRNLHRAAAIVGLMALTALGAPGAASAAAVPIGGTITPGSVGDCTEPVATGPLLRWQCVDATETYSGDLSSTADAVYRLRGMFNTRSGTTITRGTETFTGCVSDACGTLEWSWHVSFQTVAETVEVLAGTGEAHITAGRDGLAGARGSFTIKCERAAPCTYRGHVLL